MKKINISKKSSLWRNRIFLSRNTRIKKFTINHLIPILFFFLLSIFIFRNIIGVNGEIIFGDFTRPPELDKLFNWYYPLWNEHDSIPTISRLTEFMFNLPFFAIGFLFKMHTTDLSIMQFIFCEFLAGISMFYTSRYLLKKTYGCNNQRNIITKVFICPKCKKYKFIFTGFPGEKVDYMCPICRAEDNFYFSEIQIYTKIAGNKDKSYDSIIQMASFFTGLTYMWSCFMIYSYLYPFERFAFALAPFVFLTFSIGLEKKKLKYAILTGFLWCLACTDPHWTVYGAILLFSLIFFYFIIEFVKSSHTNILKTFITSFVFHVKYLIILIGCFIGFSAYWFVPGLLMGGTSRYSAVIFVESLDFYYAQSTMTNLMSKQASYYVETNVFQTASGILSLSVMQNVLIVLGLVVFIISMMALMLKRNNRYVVFFSIFVLISIFLASLVNFSSDFGAWLVLKAPLHGVYGWAFKTPIISEFIALSICFLLGFSIVEIFLRIEAHKFKRIRLKRGLGLLMICFLLISILLPKWPLATGDLNNHLIPHEMPDEFSQVNSWLEEQEEDFNVLWLPVYRSTNVDWYQNVTIGKDIAGLSSSKPTYVFWSPQLQPNTYGIYFLTCSTFYGLAPDSMIITNTTKNLGKLLAPLGIKYILFHDDNATYYNSEELRNQSDILLSQLKQQEDLKLVREYGFISVFENTYLNNKQSSCLFTTSDDFLVFGGLASLSTLSFIPSYKTEADGLLFGNQRWYNTKELNETVSGLIFTKSSVLDDIAMLFIDNKYLIAPYDYSERGIPQDTWAAVKLGHPSDRRIHMTFENLEEYDWVYDKGFVCTTSSGLLKTGAVVNDQDLLANYLFETDINDFSSLSANLSISLCYDSAIGRGSLMGIITQGTSQENQIASTTLKAIPNGVRDYRISFYLMTENASNSQVRVRFFDEEKNYINQYFLLTENGNSTFQQCEQDIHIPYNATYYDIQILANQNPITESRWWIDDIKIYDLKNYIEPNILNMDFMANTTDTYDVYMRYLKAWNGGKINLYVDNQLRSSLDTIGNSDTFIWEKITSLQLQKGSHTIAIENVDGCNAVNLIAMIPQNITTKYFEKAEEFIYNKEFIYTLEAESDFFSENATVSALYANNVSSGNVLDLSNNNSKAWIPLQIPQVGNYSLMIRYGGGDANYTLNLTIGDKYYQLGYTNESEFTWVNKTNISLTNGSQDLKFIVQPTTILSSLSFDEGWNSTTNTPEPWSSSSSQPQFTASLDTLNKTDGENSLKLTTNSTKVKKWSQINSKEIPVEANHYYQAQIDIKTENMNNTQVKIQGYNITSEKWEEITYLAITLGGTQDWKKYSRSFFISENISKIRIIINAGWVQDPTLGEATSWFDNVRVSLDSAEATNYNIDLVVMYLNKQSQTFEDLFLEQQKVPILNYEKIDATKYKVTITSTEPFTLVFNEAYDDFWIAHIDGIGDVESLPIYGMLNGFYINKTGTFTITLEYKPEQWFNIGAGITVLSIFGSCFGYLIWIKKKNFRKKT